VIIVADENISAVIIERLRAARWEVISIWESARGSSDTKILEIASRADALVITDDRDFGDLVFHQLHSTNGVMFLRLEGWSREQRAARVLEILHAHGSGLLGHFTVVSRKSVRVRDTDAASRAISLIEEEG
jgi:predicted nuclease of predicted toxin-antitoxin system